MNKYKYFTDDELRCKCGCEQLNPNNEFNVLMNILGVVREEFGETMPVSSGYRCRNHPVELAKALPGQHTRAAIDIQVAGGKAVRLMRIIAKYPLINGIGVKQHGNWSARFLHFDLREEAAMWTY